MVEPKSSIAEFRHLFSPIQIGPLLVPNRIVSTGHNIGLTTDFLPDDRMVAYYRERAKGGLGLIVIGAAHVHGSSPASGGHVKNQSDAIIPWYVSIAKAVHVYPTKIVAQLSHMGRLVKPTDESPYVLAPSALRDERFRSMPKELEEEEIAEIVESFGQAARRVREGGLDGVELQGAHGYLITAFLSPLTNKRQDRYGGSLENRLRFLREVVSTVRRCISGDYVVGMRLSGDELVDGGLTLEDMQGICQILERDGGLDYFSISSSNHGYSLGWAFHMGPTGTSLGNQVYLAVAMKEVVHLPIICVGRINDPVLAERILADGQADLVGMTRATIADPELPNKARAGRVEDIRPCVGDLYCSSRRDQRLPIRCIHNPVVGRELEWGVLDKTPNPQRTLVIGAGPGGLEAARVAALRGHEVILCEKGNKVGGQILLQSKLPTREELSEIARYLDRQVQQAGVQVRLNTLVTPDFVREVKPTAVVVATGAGPLRIDFPGADSPKVVSCWEVLEGAQTGDRVVILDDDDSYASLGTAEFLAQQGKQVQVITKVLYPGQDIEGKTRVFLYARNLRLGVLFTPHTWIRRFEGETLLTYNVYSQEEIELTGIDTIVVSSGRQSDDQLYHILKKQVSKLYRIGDCVAPRYVQHAIAEGHQVGRLL